MVIKVCTFLEPRYRLVQHDKLDITQSETKMFKKNHVIYVFQVNCLAKHNTFSCLGDVV